MAKQLQLRKGTAAEHSTFTGANGEVTVDITNKTLRVHDGTTAGGTQLATVIGGSVPAAQLPSATTSTQGIVKLNNSLTSTSTTEALTAAQGKVLKDTLDTAITSSLGVGQTWVDLTNSRAFDTNYINNTAKPIMVNAAPEGYEVTDNDKIAAYVNGVLVYVVQGATAGGNHYQTYNVSFIVPPSATYRIVGLNRVLFHWAELR